MKSFTVAAGAVVGASLLLAGTAAHAALISADAVPTGSSNVNVVVGDTTFNVASTGGTITSKTVAGFSGLGISGSPTADEIDVRETLKISWTGGERVDYFTLGVLFDGPEFNDVEEIAEVTATLVGGGTITGRLTNPFSGSAVWTTLAGTGTVTQLSIDDVSGGAVWQVWNPFGLSLVESVAFTAISNLPESCPSAPDGQCTNDSDFTFVAMQVPEPATLGLLGAGLLGAGVLRRSRRKAN